MEPPSGDTDIPKSVKFEIPFNNWKDRDELVSMYGRRLFEEFDNGMPKYNVASKLGIGRSAESKRTTLSTEAACKRILFSVQNYAEINKGRFRTGKDICYSRNYYKSDNNTTHGSYT